jgi:uncharacterized membrane protein YphA (DoxX/SURF4 family)
VEIAYLMANALSILVFLPYGLQCLFSGGMVEEFRRYGLDRFRRLVGLLEVAGALGLSAGFVFRPFAVLSATGLSVLMLCAVLARIRVRDSLVETLPALVLLLANVFVASYAMGWLPLR